MTRRPSERSMAKKPTQPTEDTLIKKARRLPLFGPGLVINVPLHLLPAYFELYGLEPVGWKNPTLLVKRVGRKKDEEKETELPDHTR